MIKRKICFIGGIFTEDIECFINENSKQGVQFAADTFQKNILLGLYQNSVTDVKVLSMPFISSYPFGFKKKIFDFVESKYQSFAVTHLKFNNFFFIKNISKSYNLYKALKKELSIGTTDIIIYSMHTAFLLPTYLLKHRYKDTHVCLIVPDLPQYMSSSKNPLYRILKKIDSVIIKKLLKSVDSYILLSDKMRQYSSIATKPSIVIEGIYNSEELKEIENSNSFRNLKDEFIFMYSGGLSEAYGVKNLLDSFELITSSKAKLWICGSGELENYIKEKSEKDSRIVFFGQIPRSKVLILQKKASILVNPRNSLGDFTKYSFPSKTIEYLASGTPCLMYKLPTLPTDYLPHIYIIEENDLHNSMLHLLKKPKDTLKQKGEKAKDFIIKNKTSTIQVKKILNFLNKR